MWFGLNFRSWIYVSMQCIMSITSFNQFFICRERCLKTSNFHIILLCTSNSCYVGGFFIIKYRSRYTWMQLMNHLFLILKSDILVILTNIKRKHAQLMSLTQTSSVAIVSAFSGSISLIVMQSFLLGAVQTNLLLFQMNPFVTWSREMSRMSAMFNFKFQYNLLVHLRSYILIQTPL